MSFIDDLQEPLEEIAGAFKSQGPSLSLTPQQITQIVCMIAKVISSACGTQGCAPPVVVPKFAYGRIKDKPDTRDFKLSRPILSGPELPISVDLRQKPFYPGVYDQGQLGSCVDNMGAFLVQFFCLLSDYTWKFLPSRLFAYYNVRLLNGTVLEDSGSTIRDFFTATNKSGICPESEGDGTTPNWLWTYSDNQFKFRLPPPHQCYTDAVLHKSLKYEAVPQTNEAMQSVLAAGLPFGIGIDVYESFESDATIKTGIIRMPNTQSEQLLGGHALSVVGYLPASMVPGLTDPEDSTYYIIRNSWGEGVGDKGHMFMPAKYLLSTDLSSDFWQLELIGFQKAA